MTDTDTDILKASEYREIIKNTLKLQYDETNVDILHAELRSGAQELIGFMGEYYKLEITIADKRKSTECETQTMNYFIKSVPLKNPLHRDECERKGFFVKEECVYSEILPNIQQYASIKLSPIGYYTRKDLLVLEDLLAAGYRHSDATYTMNHYKIILKHLAELHAASIAWEEAENFNIGEKFGHKLTELMLTTKNEWYTTGVKGIIWLAKQHPKFQNPKIQHFIDMELYEILCNAEELTKPSKELRNVFCHRDTWDRNILFKFYGNGQPSNCCIVDFQLSRYCPPAIDILFLLYITASAPIRRAISDECLAYYYTCLQTRFKVLNIAGNVISPEDFAKDCQRARLGVLIIWAICEPLTKMPKGLSRKMRAEEQETFDYYMNSDRHELFERLMTLDENYRDIIMTPIEELLHYVLDNAKLF